MIPRNPHVGTNSTTLDASFGDPATLALAVEAAAGSLQNKAATEEK